jgi:hypothetical protein
MRMYLSLCDCWGYIEMSTIIEMDGSFWLDEGQEQDGLTLTDCTKMVKGILDGMYADEYLEFIGTY